MAAKRSNIDVAHLKDDNTSFSFVFGKEVKKIRRFLLCQVAQMCRQVLPIILRTSDSRASDLACMRSSCVRKLVMFTIYNGDWRRDPTEGNCMSILLSKRNGRKYRLFEAKWLFPCPLGPTIERGKADGNVQTPGSCLPVSTNARDATLPFRLE